MANWRIKKNDKIYGPYSSKQLKTLANEGKIAGDTEISKDGEKWVAASKVQGLFSTHVGPKQDPGNGIQVANPELSTEKSSFQINESIPVGNSAPVGLIERIRRHPPTLIATICSAFLVCSMFCCCGMGVIGMFLNPQGFSNQNSNNLLDSLSTELSKRVEESESAAILINGKSGGGYETGRRVDENIELSQSDERFLVIRSGNNGWLIKLDRTGKASEEIQLNVKTIYSQKNSSYTPLNLVGRQMKTMNGVRIAEEFNVVVFDHTKHSGKSRVDVTTGFYQNNSRDESFTRWKGDGVFLKRPGTNEDGG